MQCMRLSEVSCGEPSRSARTATSFPRTGSSTTAGPTASQAPRTPQAAPSSSIPSVDEPQRSSPPCRYPPLLPPLPPLLTLAWQGRPLVGAPGAAPSKGKGRKRVEHVAEGGEPDAASVGEEAADGVKDEQAAAESRPARQRKAPTKRTRRAVKLEEPAEAGAPSSAQGKRRKQGKRG